MIQIYLNQINVGTIGTIKSYYMNLKNQIVHLYFYISITPYNVVIYYNKWGIYI